MKKIYMSLFLVIGTIIMFSGCTVTDKKNNNEVINTYDETQEIKQLKTKQVSDFSYKYDTDCQSDREAFSTEVYTPYGHYQVTKNEMTDDNYLMYFDYETGEKVFVCGKNNCQHNDSSCNAYFDKNKFPMCNLWNYEGNLYTPMIEDGNIWICKISPDGSTREKICKIMRQYIEIKQDEEEVSESDYFPEIQLHRGYIYFTDYYMGAEASALYRVKLEENANVECLYRVSGKNTSIYRIKPYGKYVLFQMGISKENTKDVQDNIYAYDTENNKLWYVCKDVYRDYTVIGENLYYVDLERNIKRMNLTTGEQSEFYKCKLDTENTYNLMVFAYGKNIVVRIKDVLNENSSIQYELDEAGKIVKIRKEADKDVLLTPYSDISKYKIQGEN